MSDIREQFKAWHTENEHNINVDKFPITAMFKAYQAGYDSQQAEITRLTTIIEEMKQVEIDAKRYRWLKQNYAMANFDIYEAENKEDRVSGLIFEIPNDIRVSADLDSTIDEAMRKDR